MGERLKLWAESSLGLCTPCSKVLVNIKVQNSLLETETGMVTILIKFYFFYFYCLECFGNAFLIIKEKLSISHRVIIKQQSSQFFFM